MESVASGINMIKERLHKRKVLLILDDMDKLKQIENLFVLGHMQNLLETYVM